MKKFRYFSNRRTDHCSFKTHRPKFVQQAEIGVCALDQPAVIESNRQLGGEPISTITAMDKKVCSSLNCQNVATRHLKFNLATGRQIDSETYVMKS